MSAEMYEGRPCKTCQSCTRYKSTRNCVPCAKRWSSSQDPTTPRMRWHQQRMNARKRGIEWKLSFEQWWAIWQPHFDKRGRTANDLVMARHGDVGAYETDNVKIITKSDNTLEYHQRVGHKVH